MFRSWYLLKSLTRCQVATRLFLLSSPSFPMNLETAMEVEAIVRDGAIPVSVAILDGIPCVDWYLCFFTGGIGRVNRHGAHTVDISSDLTELGRTPVAVISAGVKSILDIPRTLKYLETQGISIAAYKTYDFPAFFTKTSGCKVPCHVDSSGECTRLIDANRKFNNGNGVLIAVPIPKEHSASGSLIEPAIQRALKGARLKLLYAH